MNYTNIKRLLEEGTLSEYRQTLKESELINHLLKIQQLGLKYKVHSVASGEVILEVYSN